MQYLLLIYDQESQWGKLNEAEQGKMMQEYGELTKSIQQSGHYVGGNQLHPVSKATTVRVRDGKKLVTDGPFAETKEQLGGYYLIDGKDPRHLDPPSGRSGSRRGRGAGGVRGGAGGVAENRRAREPACMAGFGGTKQSSRSAEAARSAGIEARRTGTPERAGGASCRRAGRIHAQR